VRVLGIDVGAELLECWQRWLAPEVQPFFVESLRPWPKPTAVTADTADTARLSPELRDTYKTWKLDRALKTLWLDEEAFLSWPRPTRAALVRSQVGLGRGAVPTVRGWLDLADQQALRSQADGHRFVWWPSLLAGNADAIVSRAVSTGEPASRHREVTSKTWRGCADVLPAAKALVGAFAPSSGPNCFGTVMAAAGVEGAADVRMLQQPFLAWLASACRPETRDHRDRRDHDPGAVLVWRNRDGLPVHAAVTIGDDWAMEKPSQSWASPRVVLAVDELIRVNRASGQRLERHRLL
jgi:hypothetical protein